MPFFLSFFLLFSPLLSQSILLPSRAPPPAVEFGLSFSLGRELVLPGGLVRSFVHPTLILIPSLVCVSVFVQYVAPEVLELLENKKSGSSSYSGTAADAWSLGVNLYVMLCGYPPFDGDNQALLFQAIRKGQWEFDGDGWVDISAAAKDLVKGLMHQVREGMGGRWLRVDRGARVPDPRLPGRRRLA